MEGEIEQEEVKGELRSGGGAVAEAAGSVPEGVEVTEGGGGGGGEGGEGGEVG